MNFNNKTPSVLSKEDIQKEIKAKQFLLANKRKIFLNKEKSKEETPKSKTRNFLWEIGLAIGWVFILSLLSLFGIRAPYDPERILTLGSYQLNKDLLLWGCIIFLAITLISQLVLFVINPPGTKPQFKKFSSLIYDFILILAGIGGFAVLLSIFVTYAKFPIWLSYYLSSLIALTYDYFITKLFAYEKISDKSIFWEIIRFALVGVIASVFDFSITFTTRILLNNNGLNQTLITFIAVTLGFIIGVIVNYLCSIYMVYKASKKSYAKKWYGVVIFVALSAVGLFIGIGLESLFYDLLHLTYIAVFIIRTVVVMIWNYLSRKLIIFR